ncbi:hypothetical protein K458DRAFT_335019 [Lentithecium fluviatile CBS 122367]|uniref:Circumsporozoite protein n=1 Tax=Lentithecium fluviatile CBS 122367 TaxID=1168545 RepID=A0A6G1J8T2_9PLEO|nr:hypothetical protein K458DRAFT_335019 [Lentithecium fluviatile CBS 122367]
MVSKALLIAAVIAYVEARFGQEQIPIQAISQVQGGDAGAAATIAGAAISDLLGAANACDKLVTADKIVADLGGGADAIAAAIGMVTAEKNTNPFANGNVQNVCGDPTLPATAELRGITPLIDPAVDVNGDVAALSASSAASPLAADGLSIFDLLDQAGLGDLVVAQQPAGGAAAGGAAAGGAAGNANNNQNQNANDQNANDDANADDQAAADDAAACDAQNADDANADDAQNANDNQAAAGDNNQQGANNQTAAGNDQAAAGDNQAAAGGADAVAGAGASTLTGGEDFGQCTPTITFQGGEGNRPPTEFTFQIADPLARGGQGEALNPNIITNALCNQLTNVCGANDAAITACEAAKAQVEAAGTRNKSTADLFNTALGFEGFVTNPAGGPDDVPAAGAAANKVRRSFRA